MTMNLVGQQKAVRSAQLHENMDEDIVYSVTERNSGKASQPITTRSFTTSSLILYMKKALVLLGSFFTVLIY